MTVLRYGISHRNFIIFLVRFIDDNLLTKQPYTNTMDPSIVDEFLDLSDLSGALEKAILLRTVGDILQMCDEPCHACTECTEYDQVMSAVSCVTRWAPASLFKTTVSRCNCVSQDPGKSLQAVAFLGMTGLMVVAKEVTDRNKEYLIKR